MEVEMKIRGLMMDPVTNMPIVVLKDAKGSAVLPIWVGVYEANAIALEIEKVQTPRPMTHDLLRNVFLGLERAGAKSGGERSEGRHVLRADLGGAQRRTHVHRFAPQRRPGAGPARRLPDFRGRRSPEELQNFQRHLRKIHQRRTAQMARRTSPTRTWAATRCRCPIAACGSASWPHPNTKRC